MPVEVPVLLGDKSENCFTSATITVGRISFSLPDLVMTLARRFRFMGRILLMWPKTSYRPSHFHDEKVDITTMSCSITIL